MVNCNNPPNIAGKWKSFSELVRIETPGAQPTKPSTFDYDLEITQNGKFVTIINGGKINEVSIGVWKPNYKINSNNVLFWELYVVRQTTDKFLVFSPKLCSGGRVTEMNSIYLELGFGVNTDERPVTISSKIVRVD